jgi:hypothetical protein
VGSPEELAMSSVPAESGALVRSVFDDVVGVADEVVAGAGDAG